MKRRALTAVLRLGSRTEAASRRIRFRSALQLPSLGNWGVYCGSGIIVLRMRCVSKSFVGFDIYSQSRETRETSHGSHPDAQAAFLTYLLCADLCPDMGLRDPTDTLRCP